MRMRVRVRIPLSVEATTENLNRSVGSLFDGLRRARVTNLNSTFNPTYLT